MILKDFYKYWTTYSIVKFLNQKTNVILVINTFIVSVSEIKDISYWNCQFTCCSGTQCFLSSKKSKVLQSSFNPNEPSINSITWNQPNVFGQVPVSQSWPNIPFPNNSFLITHHFHDNKITKLILDTLNFQTEELSNKYTFIEENIIFHFIFCRPWQYAIFLDWSIFLDTIQIGLLVMWSI